MTLRGCFTIIELLVVVSIIFILMSMSLSVLHQGKMRAQNSQCRSILSTMGRIEASYAVDYDGFVIPTVLNSLVWMDYFGAYDRAHFSRKTSDDALFFANPLCPSNNNERYITINIGLAVSFNPSNEVAQRYHGGYCRFVTRETTYSPLSNSSMRQSKIRESSTKIDVQEGYFAILNMEDYIFYAPPIGAAPWNRHLNKTANLLFFDGHVGEFSSNSLNSRDDILSYYELMP